MIINLNCFVNKYITVLEICILFFVCLSCPSMLIMKPKREWPDLSNYKGFFPDGLKSGFGFFSDTFPRGECLVDFGKSRNRSEYPSQTKPNIYRYGPER